MIMGFENLCILLYDQPDLVEAVFNRVGSLLVEILRRASNYRRVGALWISDDLAYTSGPMINPRYYRSWLFPWYRQMKAIGAQHDLPFILHSDGLLWPIMNDLLDIGFNAIQPIEPKVMDIAEVKQRIGDRVCLIGNVGLDYPLARGTPDEVDQAVKELVQIAAPGGGFCLGSSNTVTDYVPLENFVAMIEACRQYGNY